MKNACLILFFTFFFQIVKGQKENNIWVGGDETGINFNSGVPDVFARPDGNLIRDTDASICDKNGELLFYTNGYRIFNKNFQIMENGDGLNIGDFINFGDDAQNVENGAGIIPIPGDSSKYYLFYEDFNYINNFDTVGEIILPTHLMFCLIDMAQNGGLGSVIQRDVVIYSDTLTGSGFKIAKHANGKAYWLICHKAESNTFIRFLIDTSGIHGPLKQNIGTKLNGLNAYIDCPLIMSKNITKAAQIIPNDTSFDLYDFDRCSGTLYGLQNYKVSDTASFITSGEFSPSERFFYANADFIYIYQFDITSKDILDSRKLIASYDGEDDPFESNYENLCLGPDNRIYVHSYDFDFSLHVINYPDSEGLGCNFIENAVQLNPPGWDWQGFPNVVNYSLGPLPALSCDTVSYGDIEPQLPIFNPPFKWNIFPNPVSDNFQSDISEANTDADLEIFNLLGEKVYSTTQKEQGHFVNTSINLSSLAQGMYIVKMQVNGETYERKIVKQ